MLLSHWEKTSYYNKADIIIIGAGLMGLWSAWELLQKDPTLRITIVERNPTPLGASTRNAGFACFGSLTELLSDEAAIGTDAMLAIVEMRYKGIEKIKQLFAPTEIDYDSCGGYETVLANHPSFNLIADKIDYYNQLLHPFTKTNAFQLATHKLPELGLQDFDALIFNACEAGLHSGKLVRSLTKKLIEKGVQVINGVAVKNYHSTNTDATVVLENDIELKASQLLITTNAFTNSLVGEAVVTPGRGQILLTNPIPNLKTIGTFHFDEGFYYWRNLQDRILIGGGRNAYFTAEETTDFTGSDAIKEILIQFLKKHFTTEVSIDQHWSGIMGFTKNKKPLLKKLSDHVHIATACNGMGVALSPAWAENIANTML
jgi:gamma-glutamylputrescine oxidase